MSAHATAIIGGGVTGLAAGRATGGRVYEARDEPGGICGSYYVTPDGARHGRPPSDDAYRFEVGGGHWIFGGDPATLSWIHELAPCRSYRRRSSVIAGSHGSVPYPIQHHLARLGDPLASSIAAEIDADPPGLDGGATMTTWLRAHFGPTLCDLFFDPFHERYTAGLAGSIAPQDGAKSPVQRDAVLAGVRGERPGGGYNERFVYPVDGLDALAHAMAAPVDVRFGRRVVHIDTGRRELQFADGSGAGYDRLISTLPLHVALELAGVEVDARRDPHTSVLVVNVGAEPGPALGGDHWVYDPSAESGFHRYGVYSNVDDSFLPAGSRAVGARPASRASLYIERAYPGSERPDGATEAAHVDAMVGELQDRGVIGATEVVDPTWIDVAYTWSWPGSTWVADARSALAAAGVHQVGRYGRWHFQGIAESIRDGLDVGAGRPEPAARS